MNKLLPALAITVLTLTACSSDGDALPTSTAPASTSTSATTSATTTSSASLTSTTSTVPAPAPTTATTQPAAQNNDQVDTVLNEQETDFNEQIVVTTPIDEGFDPSPDSREECPTCLGNPEDNQQGGWAPGYGPNGPETPAVTTPDPWVQGQIDWQNCKESGKTDEQCRAELN